MCEGKTAGWLKQMLWLYGPDRGMLPGKFVVAKSVNTGQTESKMKGQEAGLGDQYLGKYA